MKKTTQQFLQDTFYQNERLKDDATGQFSLDYIMDSFGEDDPTIAKALNIEGLCVKGDPHGSGDCITLRRARENEEYAIVAWSVNILDAAGEEVANLTVASEATAKRVLRQLKKQIAQ